MKSNKNSALTTRAEIEAQANWWFARLRSGGCSESERAAHKVWLNSNLAHRKAYKELEDMWVLIGDFSEKEEIRDIREKALMELGLSNLNWDEDEDGDEESMGPFSGSGWRSDTEASLKAPQSPTSVETRGEPRSSVTGNKNAPAAAGKSLWLSPSRWIPVAVAASLLVVFLGVDFSNESSMNEGGFQTAIGEQKTVSLDDGSLLLLDTQTKVITDFTATQRRIILENGQARFDVAKDKARPFIVEAGPGKVTAIGTAFVIRKENSDVLVTLLEGKVAVEQQELEPAAASVPPGEELPQMESSTESNGTAGRLGASPNNNAQSGTRKIRAQLTLEAGQQVSYSDKGISEAEEANLEQVTAWQNGRLVFEDDTLAEVLKDLNRYSHNQILIGDKELETIRITGVFKTGDNKRIVDTLKIYFSLRVTSDKYGNLILLNRRGSEAG